MTENSIFKDILDIAGEAIISVDENYRIMLFNRKAEQIFGYDADEIIGQPVNFLLPQRFLGVHQDHMDGFSHSDISSRLMGERQEVFGLRRNGEEFPATASISKVKNNNKPIFTVIIQDITHQKQTEHELNKHQNQLETLVETRTKELNNALAEMEKLNENLELEIAERAKAQQELQSQLTLIDSLLDAALDTIEIFDPKDMSYLKWNRTFSELTGYSDEEISRMNPADDFYDEAELPKVNAAVQEALITGEVSEVATLITKDGSRVPIEYTGSVTRDPAGNPLHLIAIGRDISERLKSEEQLRFQAELLNVVEQAILVTDLEGQVVYWNPYAEKLYGWTAEEAIGRRSDELIVVDYEDALITQINATLLSGKSWTGEFMARRRDGSLLPTQTTITNFSNEGEEPTYSIGVAIDITERKKAEESLLASREFTQSSLDALPDHITILDNNGVILEVNDSWRKFADQNNLAWDDYGVGHNYLEIAELASRSGDTDADKAAAGLREMFAGLRDSLEFEYPCHSPDEKRWFVMRVTCFGSNERLRLVISHENITSRKKGQVALLESEQKFRALFQGMPVPVYTWQRSGQDFVLVDANSEADTITGGNLRDFMGMKLSAMYPDRPDIVQDVSHTFSGKVSFQREMEYSFKSTGEDKTLLVKYTYVPPDLVMVQTEDVTQQRLAEDALIASEEKYRDLVEKVSDVIYSVDAEGILTYASPAIESLLDISPEEAIGKPVAGFILPDDLDRINQNFQKLITGTVPGPNEYRMLTSSGETRWVRLSSQPIEVDGRVTGLQGVLTDITERKKLEDQLEETATVAERQRLARELHDSVTQSLYSMNLQTDATQMALAAGNIDKAERRLEILREISKEAMTELRLLIYQLHPSILEEAGLAVALRQRLDAVETRSGVVADFQIEGERRLPAEIESNLFHVAQEGLNNALKHAKASEIQVRLSFEPHVCQLTIRDNGVGFDPETINHYGGYGLANMSERLEKINGVLTINSQPGEGTTLEIEVLL